VVRRNYPECSIERQTDGKQRGECTSLIQGMSQRLGREQNRTGIIFEGKEQEFSETE
jgi:hypothetical protein